MKKHLVPTAKRWALALTSLMLLGCAELEPVVITQSLSLVNGHTVLNSHEALGSLVADGKSFVIAVTNMTCTCTLDFLPLYDDFLSEVQIVGYTIEYSFLQYEEQKFDLSVEDANTPILAIFDTGLLKYQIEYIVGNASHNRVFTVYEELNAYLGARINAATA